MGVFEPNYTQARYMPFEYLELKDNQIWELMLDENAEFDLTTISDVVFHIRYYAENDSSTIETIDEVNVPSVQTHLLMSWKHDFPLEWQQYIDDSNNSVPSQSYPTLNTHQIPYKLRDTLNAPGNVDQAFKREGYGLDIVSITKDQEQKLGRNV